MNILPWLIRGGEEAGDETARELELALVLAAVEQERDKGGGIIKKKTPENIHSIFQLFWPLYLIKQTDANRYIIFDGLGLFDHVLENQALPQTESFEKHLVKNTPSNVPLNDYLAFLSSNTQVFANVGDLARHNLAGCIGQEELIKSLTDYFQTSAHINTIPEAQIALRFPPDLANKQVSILAGLKNDARADIQHLEDILNKLADTAKQWADYLEGQQFEVAESFNKQIESVSHDIEPKIQNYGHLMQEELGSIERSLSPLISNLHAEVSRWEREEERWNNLGDKYNKSRNSAKTAKNKAKRELNNAINERENSIDKAKTYYTDLIKEEQEKLISLENERNERQKALKSNEDEIMHLTSVITDSLSSLVEAENSFLASSAKVEIEFPVTFLSKSSEEPVSVLLPFWVAFFESSGEGRFLVLPPCLSRREKNFKDWIKNISGSLNLPVEPLSEIFNKTFKQKLEQTLSNDESFAQEVKEQSKTNNIIRQEITTTLERGLNQLTERGWLKEKQLDQIRTSFEQSITVQS